MGKRISEFSLCSLLIVIRAHNVQRKYNEKTFHFFLAQNKITDSSYNFCVVYSLMLVCLVDFFSFKICSFHVIYYIGSQNQRWNVH